ncbi:MAG: esterase [Bacteroidales bacterium]|nr:esterase [Bacteroidales bacterium]
MHYEEHLPGDRPLCLLLQPTARHEAPALDEEVRAVEASTDIPFAFGLLHVDDWAIDLMPWPDRKISRDERAGQCAGQTLRFIRDVILPRYPGLPVVLGGYSLAGLFALWASMQCDAFTAIAAASPSLWTEGWIPYAREHAPHSQAVYLSLGDREETSKNQAIARVGDCVRMQQELLRKQLGDERCTLVWEQGGHFSDNAGRLARAFAWCLTQMNF